MLNNLFQKKKNDVVLVNDLFSFSPSSYIDLKQERETKIILEKRRRNQSYQTLNYLISLTTYFDFFSKDAFDLAKVAKYFTQLSGKKRVNSEFLVLAFFNITLTNPELFKNYNLTKNDIEEFISNFNDLKTKNWYQKDFDFFKKSVPTEFLLENNIEYSQEVNLLFEKASENALLRFKTPVVTPEILFITMMDEKQSRACKLIKKFVGNETNWLLLRYNLIKLVHSQEVSIRSEVIKNNQFFAYLLKTQLSEMEFNKLVKEDTLAQGVIVFRNNLIVSSLKMDLANILENDIKKSIKLNNIRSYQT